MSQLIRYSQSRERPDRLGPSRILLVQEVVPSSSESGNSFGGASAHGTSIKVAVPSGRSVAGGLAAGASTKLASASATSVAGALARGVDIKIVAQSGFSFAGALARGTAAKIAPESGRSVAGALARGAVTKVALSSGASYAGALARGLAAKIAASSGVCVAGASTNGVASASGVVSASGTSFAGGLASGFATKTAIDSGVAAAGASTYGIATSAGVVSPIGSCSAGVSANGGTAKTVALTGDSVVGSSSSGIVTIPPFIPPISVAGLCFVGVSAQGLATFGGDPMLTADFFVGPLMLELLACMCEQSAQAANPPGICCFRVGTEIAHDAGINEDQCCEGIAYVALGDTYPSGSSFPEQDFVRQADAKCPPPTWAQVFKVGIIRCLPTVGDAYNPPNCTDWNAAALQNVIDAQTLRRVACCFRDFITLNDERFLGMSVVIERQNQSTPQGGCVERSMTLIAQFPNCDC